MKGSTPGTVDGPECPSSCHSSLSFAEGITRPQVGSLPSFGSAELWEDAAEVVDFINVFNRGGVGRDAHVAVELLGHR